MKQNKKNIRKFYQEKFGDFLDNKIILLFLFIPCYNVPEKKRCILLKLQCQLLKKGQVELEYKDIPYQLDDNILKFQLEDVFHEIDLQKKTFIRENDEYSFFLDVESQTSEISLKNEKYYLQVLVEYANLLTMKNMIKLTYFLETDDNEMEFIIELEGENFDNE